MGRVKVFWYKADGSVRGSVVHDITWYRWFGDGTSQGINGNCPRRFLS
jgi:hypothetical protein